MPKIPTYKEQERFKSVNAHDTKKFDVPPPVSDIASTKIVVDDMKAQKNRLSTLSDLGKNLQEWGNDIPKLKEPDKLTSVKEQNQLTSAIANFTALKQDPELQDKLYGENGIFTQKGEASFDLPEQFKNVVQEYGRKYSEKVKGNIGTSYFNEQLQSYISSYAEKANEHASREYTNWQLQTHFRASSLALEEAINNFDNPNLFKEATATAMFNTRLVGQLSGLSEENIDINVKDIASKSYLGIANKMLVSGNINESTKILDSGMLSEADNYAFTNSLRLQQKNELSESRKVAHIAKTASDVKLKSLAENLSTNMAYATTTGDTSSILEVSKQYRDLGDEKSAKKVEKRVKVIEDNYELIISMNEQKLPERINTLKTIKSELNSSKVKKNSRAYQSLMQRKELAELNVKDYNILLKNDPAKATKVDIQGTLYEIAKQRVDGQVENGLTMPETRVLTRDEANEMSNLWEDAGIDERVGIAENLKNYGLYAPRVAGELGLDFVEQLGIRHLGENSAYLPSLKKIISANSTKSAEFQKIENIEALREEVCANSKVFQTYTNIAASNSENKVISQNISQLQKGINNILHQNNGNATRAIKIIDGELDAINNTKMNILFYATKIDKDTVEKGLSSYLGQELEQFLKDDLGKEQINTDEYLQHLREKAIWQNDFDTNEYLLVDSESQKPVKNAKGKIFRKSDSDLLALSL